MAGNYRNIYYAVNRYCFSLLPDVLYHNLLGWIMHCRFGVKYHWMNIQHPRTFSEKLQWLKQHGDIGVKTRLADKYDVRDFVHKRIGSSYLVKLLKITNNRYYATSADEVDFQRLPSQFVLKLTKGSGYNIICRNKDELDIAETRETLRRWLKVKNYYLSREPQYRGQNRIICERMLEYNITDYKFFCFNGEPRFFKVDLDRFTEHHANYYDINWHLLELNENGCPRNPDAVVEQPSQYDEMVSVARRLAEGFPFVRVDLYIHDGKVYFGEMTFHPAGGYAPLTPHEWEYRIGEMIQLPT